MFFFFFSSRRRHTRYWRDWSSDVCSSDLTGEPSPRPVPGPRAGARCEHRSALLQGPAASVRVAGGRRVLHGGQGGRGRAGGGGRGWISGGAGSFKKKKNK